MNKRIKWQMVWWWRLPRIKVWAFPRTYKESPALENKPIFWGLYLGIFEIRYFPTHSFEAKQ